MLRNILSRRALLASAALALVVRPARADDEPKLSGAWEKTQGEMKLEFDGKELTLYPHGDKVGIACSYTATKDGVVKAKVKDFVGAPELVEKMKDVLPVGTAFQFKWKAEGDAATLEALEGREIEHAKDRFEGGYAKKA